MIKNLDDLWTPEIEVPSTYAEDLLLRTHPSLIDRIFGAKVKRPIRGSIDSHNLWAYLNVMAALEEGLYIVLGGKQRTYVVKQDHQFSPAIYDIYQRRITSLSESCIHLSQMMVLVQNSETAYTAAKNDSSPLFYGIGLPKIVEENRDLLPIVAGYHRDDHNSRILAASLVRTLAQSRIIKDGTYRIEGDYRQMSPEGFSVELTELCIG